MKTSLTTARSTGALIIRFISQKFDALRYLPKLAFGFLQLNASGQLEATTDPVIAGNLKFAPTATPTVINNAGAGTYTAAQLASGIIARDPNGAGRTDTTDTAANLISGLGLTADYQERFCVVRNTADAAETITMAAGAGVTLQAAITIAQNSATKLAIMRTGAAAVVVRQV